MIAEQLKRSILQAAIQGKLTQQFPDDRDARDYLKEIQKGKNKLIKAGKIKKEKEFPKITEDEIPFDIPESWCWVRLGELAQFISKGTTPAGGKNSYINSGVGFVRAENVGQDGRINQNNLMFIDELTHTTILKRSVLEDMDLLICIAGTLGRSAIVEAKYLPLNTNQAVSIVRLVDRGNSSVNYLQKAISSFSIQQHLINQTKVTAIPNLTLEIINNCIVPLPPLAEQQRIIERIDGLFLEIDKLKYDETKLSNLQKSFPKKMKDSIIQHAIQGKLTEQLPDDGTANDLLKETQKVKARLIKEGKIKKEKLLPEITEDEILFDIPENWEWVRLRDLGITQTGNTPSRAISEYFGDFIPFISPGDILNGDINYQNQGLSQKGKEVGRVSEKCSILQVCIGGSIGKCAVNTMDVTYNQQINSITPILSNHLYLYYLVDSPFFQSCISNKATGTATPIINKSTWENIVVPLPPLKEQDRIVKKLDILIPLCNKIG